jgi:2-polyprenyl-3-methyl-5-hydroxy-6-metoxy-1,4-benzoquinol methylase
LTRDKADLAEDWTGQEFARYKRLFVDAMRLSLNEHGGRLHYAALPAYGHRNPLIRFLFWQRIRSVMRYLNWRSPWESVLDFGCGAGVLLPFFATRAKRVLAADVDISALEAIARYVPLASNVDVFDLGTGSLSDLAPESCDLIVALDVLEHVQDLAGTAIALRRVLAPRGELIVSGPTENYAYRVGRRIAGRDFTADYHVRNIRDVRKTLASTFNVLPISTLFHAIPLFVTYRAVRPPRPTSVR